MLSVHELNQIMIHYGLLLQGAEEHATPGKIALEYIGFLSFFGVYGALGFHFHSGQQTTAPQH